MRRALLVILLLCLFPTFGRAQSDGDQPDRHGQRHKRRLQLSFDARLDYPTGGHNLLDLVTADFNRDGDLDVATLDDESTFAGASDFVSIFLGDGRGRFTRAPDVPLGSSDDQVALVAADFDRDGRIDLAVLAQRSNSIRILSGRKNGTFEPTLTIPAGPHPVALATGDFDGDRRPDLAALNQPFAGPLDPPGTAVPGTITLLLGQRGGGFQSTTVPVGLSPSKMTEGDFNRDGHSDLAVISSGSVAILLDGQFQSAPPLLVPGAFLLATGDINGDRRLDLAVLGGQTAVVTATVLLGGGNGTFEAGQSVPVAPEPPLLTPSGFQRAITIGDFIGDHNPDIAVIDAINSVVTLLVGVGDGTLEPGPAFGVGGFPAALESGDFNGDRRLDLATAGSMGELSILEAERGGFQAAPVYPVGCCPSGLVTGDYDEDGHIDVVAANFVDRTVTTLIGGRRGRFNASETSTVQTNPSQMASADFNRDGHLDLAMSNPGIGGGGNTVSIALGRGDGTFQAGQVLSVGAIPEAIVTDDFNEDGIPDLAVANDFSFTVSILRGVGDGTFLQTGTVPVGRNPLGMTITDANGDGHADLIVANTNQNNTDQPGSVSVLLGHGNGTFIALAPVTVGVRPISVAAADFNDDDVPDLAVLNQFGEALSLLLGNGDGTFAIGTTVTVSGDHVVAGDFDADGRIDLAVSSTDNHVALWLGTGDGRFETGPMVGTGNEPRTVVAADFDRDGLLDLATGDYYARTVSIVINTSEPSRRDED